MGGSRRAQVLGPALPPPEQGDSVNNAATRSPQRVNVGLIGAGFMGKAHSLAYAAMPMFFWPAPAVPHRRMLAELDPAVAHEAASRFGFEESTSNWRAVVESDDVDLVDISVPNDAHAEIAIAAAQAGKHVLCEKPLARTVEEARAM